MDRHKRFESKQVVKDMKYFKKFLLRRLMRLLPLALALVLVLINIGPMAVQASPDWYDAAWAYRKQITIVFTKVAGNLSDFPVLISLAADTDLAADAQDDGDDILFTAFNGVTKLSYEIEKFNGTTGELIAWVKVPSLSATANTDIYIYYGNSGASNQQDSANVWDSNFKMVQHLAETAGTHYDSTANNNDGTPQGGVTQTANGKINGADNFDGTNDYIAVPLDATGFTAISISAWVNLDRLYPPGGEWYEQASTIVLMGNPDGYTEWLPTWQLWASHVNAHTFTFGSHEDFKVTATFTPTLGEWYYVVGTYDPSTNNISLYVNGHLENTVSYTYTGEETTNDSPIWIGRGGYDDGEPSRWLDGTIDEVHISNTPRSSSWVSTEYNNQNNPAAFYTLGAEESAGSPPAPQIGGTVYPVNKILVLTPYLLLMSIIGAGGGLIVRRFLKSWGGRRL